MKTNATPPARVAGGSIRRAALWILPLATLTLSAVSTHSTVSGARLVLDPSIADGLGAVVQMLFTVLLLDLAPLPPLRRWAAVVVLATCSIWTSTYQYRQTMIGEQEADLLLDRALTASMALQGAVVAPLEAEHHRLLAELEAAEGLRDREAQGRGTTGRSGWGPKARQYAEDAEKLRGQAVALQARVQTLRDVADEPADTAQDLWRRDHQLWTAASATERASASPPLRSDYVSGPRVELLTPLHGLRAGELASWLGLALATLVDGLTVWLSATTSALKARPPGPLLVLLRTFEPTCRAELAQLMGERAEADGRLHIREMRRRWPVEHQLLLRVLASDAVAWLRYADKTYWVEPHRRAELDRWIVQERQLSQRSWRRWLAAVGGR